MLSKKQLEDAAKCEERLCRGCEMLTDNAGYCAQAAAQTALAFRAMLERLEWSHINNFNSYNGYCLNYCPICGRHKEQGHSKRCELAALLKESEVEHDG